jgi:hypothetical protein
VALDWCNLEDRAMPNYRAADFGALKRRARRTLRSMQRRPTFVRAFWLQAVLF